MERNLLVLSDIHLGCDLIQHCRPEAPTRSDASARRDAELVALLDWYRTRRLAERSWKLVIAGDMIDFVGMSLSARHPLGDLTAEQQLYGLGSSEDHTVYKLERVVETHDEVFAALARFVEAGNEIVIVRGNHDVDLHWPRVQAAFRRALVDRTGGSEIVAERVEFADWFFYEPDAVYIEHGHQYDPYCSHVHQLHPRDLVRPDESSRSLADVLKRYVVNPTRGLTESGHEDATLLDYVAFGTRLGARGCWALACRFVTAIGRLLANQWRRDSARVRELAREHAAHIRRFAREHGLCCEKVRKLAELWFEPCVHSTLGLFRSLMLDRLTLAVSALVALGWMWLSPLELDTRLAVGLLTLPVFGAAGVWCWRGRVAVDSSDSLRRNASEVARLLPSKLVVMGHTHIPESSHVTETTRYVNLGGWAEPEAEEGVGAALPATRTHLVVPAGREAQATLFEWNRYLGPVPYRPRDAAPESGRAPAESSPGLGIPQPAHARSAA